ncbi:MAG TPA: NAD(P)-dependent oxidoreductase [Anaeromyxobacter sp.]|nr:NAD(P)-dependent oxidoreductase [Anaeromyxobacter sp.]
MDKVIGFIGLGNMGAPMASRLLDAGYELHVLDARPEAAQPFVARGAKVARSPAEVAHQASVVFASLPTPAVVRDVVLGPQGVATGGKVRTFVDLSTSGPKVAAEIAAGLREREITAIDAPVSGGVAGARKGTLALMVAGPRPAAEEVRPAIEALGRYFWVGEEPGMGQTMKLLNNMLSATALAATSEVMVLGVKAGLDPKVMLDVINSGTGRNSASVDKFPNAILPRTFGAGFATGLMYKDLRLCMELADAQRVPMWVSSAVERLWLWCQSRQGPQSDFTSIVKCVEEWAGVEVKG